MLRSWAHLNASSPRPWGCFCHLFCRVVLAQVFPTPVGVFLRASQLRRAKGCLPHARGGVSDFSWFKGDCKVSSPRPWGCFPLGTLTITVSSVFPTPVGVFLTQCRPTWRSAGLPHARGGVSGRYPSSVARSWSSPRPWGCFCPCLLSQDAIHVFPTPVGVFPISTCVTTTTQGLPHARGGVSVHTLAFHALLASSPRPWGCFCRREPQPDRLLVFPTPVGVFLQLHLAVVVLRGLPHARGGVSDLHDRGAGKGLSSPRPWGCFWPRGEGRG